MKWLDRALEALRTPPARKADVRMERFALGNRHQGQVLEGARLELKEPGIPWRRVLLLRAVIASHGV